MDLVEADDPDAITAFQRTWKHIEIEIGSGNGHFLAAYGERFPDVGFIGIEAKKKRCLKIRQKIKSRHLDNILLCHGTAETFLKACVKVPVQAFHIYFPDPWPKKKHRRRRFVKKEMLKTLSEFLVPNGRIYFASDVFDYYLQAKILGILDPDLKIIEEQIPDEARISLFCTRTAAVGKITNSIILEKSASDK